MIFLKVTRSVKNLGARFGWLIAEVVLVFLGMYGAFVLERMHDDDMDLLRKRQILQALVDEFANYEEELGSASNSLDEGYGIPFFTAYSSGEKPFPRPIPFGGMGSVNTGIWEAMLQSGGIEVLEVELIQGVQGFFKKLQDLLDLYSRFERLSESMILPEMDQSVDFFYESEGSELRDKYKWYVNSLFTVGMSLRELSEQAKTTKELLLAEYSNVARDFIAENNEQILPPQPKPSVVKEVDQEPEQENQVSEVDQVQDAEISNLIQGLKESLIHIEQRITESSSLFDEQVAIPFFTSYSEGLKPALQKLEIKFLVDQEIDQIKRMIEKIKSQTFATSQDEIITNLRDSLENCLRINSDFVDFISRTGIELTPSEPNHGTLYYDLNSTELKEEFMWYPNELFKFGTAFRNLSEEMTSIHEAINI
jgi:hypothetical protein